MPFRGTDEGGEILGAPSLGSFGLVGWRRVLLKDPVLVTEVLFGPRKKNPFQNFALVNLFVDFYARIHKIQRSFSGGGNSRPNHDRGRFL